MRIPPVVLVILAVVAQGALRTHARAATAKRALAASLAGSLSLGLTGAAVLQFGRHGTTVEPIDPSKASTLVTSGANAVSRNPMYVGMAGLLVAHAVWLGSWKALAPVAAFVCVIDRSQIAAEEQALLGRFGTEYEDYCARVPRWLGRASA